jgi:hypothetical protein
VYSPLFERRSRQILAMGFPNSVWGIEIDQYSRT